MAIDLNRELAALFYEHESVHLPGIGGFVLRDTPAEVDPVQGKVEAPSRQLVFDPNLVIDDGLLLTRLREEHQLSQAAAERQIKEFVAQIKSTLEQGELFTFAGIGRLYRNYNGELQFLADGRNFSADTFGLAPVELQTVTHSARPVPKPSAATPRAGGYAPRYASRATGPDTAAVWLAWLRKHLIYVIGATAFIFIIGMWLLSRNSPAEPSLETTNRVPRERLNVPPSSTQPDAAADDPGEQIQEDRPTNPLDAPATERPDAAANRYAVIAVGLFGNEDNVQKMIRRIERVGMDPFTVREGQLTRVGVQVRYQDEQALTAALRRVQARIEDGAFILEKEGQRFEPE